MSWSVISTWKMSYEGCRKTGLLLSQKRPLSDSILIGVQDVEGNPAFHSVGYGGLPDREGHVTMDAGFMDGDTLSFGAVGCLEGFRSAAAVAVSLVHNEYNNFLVGSGAEKYAELHGFEKQDNLTEESRQKYLQEAVHDRTHSSYDGHDTVCFLARNEKGSIAACTSTSGLYLKEHGRVGDTPLPGCGYYADSRIGACAATGVGEEIMKGALSRAAVDCMAGGRSAQEAADHVLHAFAERLGTIRPVSLIIMDQLGNTGVSTTIDFPFCVNDSSSGLHLFLAQPGKEHTEITEIEDPASVQLD